MAVSKTDKAAQVLGGFISALMSVGEEAAITYAEAQVPALNLPVVKQVFEFLVNKFGSTIQTFLINGATGLVINIQGAVELENAKNAAIALKFALASGDQTAIERELENAKKAYAAAINWDGIYSAP